MDNSQALDPERIYDAIYRGVRDGVTEAMNYDFGSYFKSAIEDSMPFSDLILDAIFDGTRKALGPKR